MPPTRRTVAEAAPPRSIQGASQALISRSIQLAGAPPARARLIREFDAAIPAAPLSGDPPEVPDPYYGGDDGFDNVYQMLTRACDGLLDALFASDHPLLREDPRA